VSLSASFLSSSIILQDGRLLLVQQVSHDAVIQARHFAREQSDDVAFLSKNTVAFIEGLGFLQTLRYCATQIDKASHYDPEDPSKDSVLSLKRWEISSFEQAVDFCCIGEILLSSASCASD
jgi:hypothetical protein